MHTHAHAVHAHTLNLINILGDKLYKLLTDYITDWMLGSLAN